MKILTRASGHGLWAGPWPLQASGPLSRKRLVQIDYQLYGATLEHIWPADVFLAFAMLQDVLTGDQCKKKQGISLKYRFPASLKKLEVLVTQGPQFCKATICWCWVQQTLVGLTGNVLFQRPAVSRRPIQLATFTHFIASFRHFGFHPLSRATAPTRVLRHWRDLVKRLWAAVQPHPHPAFNLSSIFLCFIY